MEKFTFPLETISLYFGFTKYNVFEFFKEYIESILSKYEWFNGVKIDVSSYKNKGKVLPFYTVMYDTGGHRWNIEEDDVENKVQTMFDLLFPKDKDGELTAVWDDKFV